MWAPNDPFEMRLDIQPLYPNYPATLGTTNWIVPALILSNGNSVPNPAYKEGEHYISYQWGSHGFFSKPESWTGKRKSPGKIQDAISKLIAAHNDVWWAMLAYSVSDKEDMDKMAQLFESKGVSLAKLRKLEAEIRSKTAGMIDSDLGNNIASKVANFTAGAFEDVSQIMVASLPESYVFGLANGGDMTSFARSALYGGFKIAKQVVLAADTISYSVNQGYQAARQKELLEIQRQIDELGRAEELKTDTHNLFLMTKRVQGDWYLINVALRKLDDARQRHRALLAEGDRLQTERQVYRQRAAAVIQGFRTRDAAFRIFRNEKLERYKSLFDLAAQYSYLAANAYDYETGLLGTPEGREFVNRIVNARALGVVKNGEPQFAGSNTGDPGLSSVLAEMKADWDVVKGRLGFNNPDSYGTTVSLRTEHLRILPGTEGDQTWRDVLHRGRVENLLDDNDIRRHCLQVDGGTGLPVPGIVLTFSTTISPGDNLFGQPLAAGDSSFDVSAFATKLFALGVALEGYRGMNNPLANGSAVNYGGGSSPPDPNLSYLDNTALAATPYVYLIPVGVDSMRSPPLGDASSVGAWNVDDVAVPLPFNIGASEFSTKELYRSADSLSEALFSVRKHQAFRPVSSASAFSPETYGLNGSLQASQFTNRRLIGRSVWNSKWKLVIPGNRLLNDPKEGLDRFIRTVTDIKLHLVTYGYAGN